MNVDKLSDFLKTNIPIYRSKKYIRRLKKFSFDFEKICKSQWLYLYCQECFVYIMRQDSSPDCALINSPNRDQISQSFPELVVVKNESYTEYRRVRRIVKNDKDWIIGN